MESTKQSVDEFLNRDCCDLDVKKNFQPNEELNPDSEIQIQVTQISEDENPEIVPENEENIIKKIDSEIQQHSEELGKIKLENEELRKNVESLEKSEFIFLSIYKYDKYIKKKLIQFVFSQ